MITPIGLSQRVFSRLQSKRNICNSNKVQSPIKLNSTHTTFIPPSHQVAVQAAKQILGDTILEHIKTLRNKFPKGEEADKYSQLAQALLNGWVSTEMINSLPSSYLFSLTQKNSGPLKGCLVQNIGEENVAIQTLKNLGACITENKNANRVAIKSHLVIGFGLKHGENTISKEYDVSIRFLIKQLSNSRLQIDDNGLLYITVAPSKPTIGEAYFEDKKSPYHEHFQKAGWEIRLHHAQSGLIIASPIKEFKLPDPQHEPRERSNRRKQKTYKTPPSAG